MNPCVFTRNYRRSRWIWFFLSIFSVNYWFFTRKYRFSVDALVMGQCVSNEAQKGHKEFCRLRKSKKFNLKICILQKHQKWHRASQFPSLHSQTKQVHSWYELNWKIVNCEKSMNRPDFSLASHHPRGSDSGKIQEWRRRVATAIPAPLRIHFCR